MSSSNRTSFCSNDKHSQYIRCRYIHLITTTLSQNFFSSTFVFGFRWPLFWLTKFINNHLMRVLSRWKDVLSGYLIGKTVSVIQSSWNAHFNRNIEEERTQIKSFNNWTELNWTEVTLIDSCLLYAQIQLTNNNIF